MSDTDATRARQNVVADVDEILEHVINANMLSMPYDVYSELFDAVDGLGIKIEKLQAENAKLREEQREYQATIDSLVDECADHKAENDRLWEYIARKRHLKNFARLVDENSQLRKLVRDMWEGYNDPRCEECHLKDTPTCADCPICAREASVIDRMRELGVEP